ncbi:MAG TPA: DEAD/DEAH box helicase, partial [Humisphaera sp.]
GGFGGRGGRCDDRRGGGRRGYDRDADIPAVDREAPQADDDADSGHQTIFVSATISDEIERLGRKYMREPVEKLIAPGADEKPTVEKVEQYFFAVEPWDKYRLLKKLLDRENPDLAIVFCRTKHGAEKLAARLHSDGIECREIHGNLNQSKRDSVMKNFRGGKFDILVATDLASRGIDVADISHIINYDLPDDPEVYVHRVGRTARMGAEGKAFSFVSRGQGGELTKVENLINMVIPQGQLEGWEPRPQPEDWKEGKPGVERQQVAAPVPAHPTTPLPPRRLGSKLPLGRRHKRLR